MKNIVLFGGGFDPIHFGHINMAEQASKQLNADIVFIPAKISVWKNDSVSPEHKFNMIKLAIGESKLKDRFSISTYEIDKSGDEVSYTIDTVRHFKETYPNNNIYLLIGQDQVDKFHLWKEALELSKLAKIVYFGRLDENLNQENIKTYGMTNIVGETNDFSSTKIRELQSLDTFDSVIDYIIDNDLYFMKKIGSEMAKNRYEHSKRVAKLAYIIAKTNIIKEPKKALIAALLHDVAKYKDKSREVVEFAPYKEEFSDLQPPLYHQIIGADKIRKEYKITDSEIVDAVKYHSTGKANMSDIAKIVYAADKIEPGRGFDSTDLINAMLCSITDGFVTVLKANVEYFKEKGIDYKNRLTQECLNFYLK